MNKREMKKNSCMGMQAANCSLAGHVDNAPVRGAGLCPHISGTRGKQQGCKRQGGMRGGEVKERRETGTVEGRM